MTTVNEASLFKAGEKIAALDELFVLSASYRSSQNFLDLLNFINKFPTLSPFNAFLIHMQNTGVELVFSARQWEKLGRKVKYNARPLVILVPFGPVEFVYDIADTEGQDIPEHLINPFYTLGNLNSKIYERTGKNCNHDKIFVTEDAMHKSSAGYATTKMDQGVYKVVVNRTYDLPTKYSTLIHELAHVYSGHLGVYSSNWWKSRILLGLPAVEIEAEAISYLVCKRAGLKTSSEEYLSNYIKSHKEMPQISLDVILTVSLYIEQLGQRGFRPKKERK